MTLRRLDALVRDLQAADPNGRLIVVLLGELGNLNAARAELQRITAAEHDLRTAALNFLEGMQAIKEAEHFADEDARLIASGGVQ